MSAYSDAVLALSPVGYWRLGEASGTTAVDAVGANNGTYVGSPVLGAAGLLTGDANTAVTFRAGAYTALASASTTVFGGTAPMSIAVWMHVSLGTNGGIISNAAAGNKGWKLWVTAAGALTFQRGAVVSTYSIANATSYFVAATYDGTTQTLFVNAVSRDSEASGNMTAPATPAFYFGTTYEYACYGTIDEPAVWDRALTAAEVSRLYQVGAQKFIGSGTLSLTASLSATGAKKGIGSGTLTGTVSFAETGRKGAAGTGSLAGVVTFASAGRKTVSGIASMALSAVLSAVGRKSASGTGSLSSTVSLSSTGHKGALGSGTLALVATLSATGRKAAHGVGALIETIVMSATGWIAYPFAARMRLSVVSDAPSLTVVSDAPTIERLT